MNIDTIPLDSTSILAPVYQAYAADRPRTQTLIAHKKTSTQALANSIWTEQDKLSGTATVADLMSQSSKRTHSSFGQSKVRAQDAFQKARNDRVQLLAKKYGGKLDTEGNARLDILSSRVQRMNPRITESHRNRLNRMQADVGAIGDEISNLRSSLGI